MDYSIEKLVFYLRGLFSAPIICELSKKKIFKFEKNRAIFNHQNLKKIKGKKELKACLNYLVRINLIYKTNNNYEFTNLGKEIFKRANSYYVPHSYREFILNLKGILDANKSIKKLKVDRDENIIGSGLTHMRYFPPILSYLSRIENIETIVDVGCGNGHFLDLVNKNLSKLNLIGFDISPISVKSAKLLKAKNNNKIILFKEDAAKFDKWEKKIRSYTYKKNSIFFFWFLLHEISKNKKSIIINYLQNIKKKYPKSKIVICELTRQSDNIFKYNSEKSLMPEYLLFHDFSGQGVLSFEDYQDILKKSGYKIVKEWLFDNSYAESDNRPEPSTFIWVLE